MNHVTPHGTIHPATQRNSTAPHTQRGSAVFVSVLHFPFFICVAFDARHARFGAHDALLLPLVERNVVMDKEKAEWDIATTELERLLYLQELLDGVCFEDMSYSEFERSIADA